MARVIDCPKCGVSQPEDVFCASCGVRIKSFQQQTRSSKTKESLIISVVAVLFLGLGIYFVQKTVRKTFNLAAPKEDIQLEDDVQHGPSPVTTKGYRLDSRESEDPSSATTDALPQESVPTTAESTTAASASVKPLGSIRVKAQKFSAEVLQALPGALAATGDSQLNIVKTAAAPKGSGSFQLGESQGWPVRIEESLNVQAANPRSGTNATNMAAAGQDPDGLFFTISKAEGSPNSLVLDGEIKITNLLASGPVRLQIHREFELAGDETAVLHGFMPRDAIKPNLRVDTISPFSVLQDQAFLTNASDIAILVEGTETSSAAP